MNFHFRFPELLKIVQHLLKWTALLIPLSVITGSLVALFLWLLEIATQLRWQNVWLLWLLPLAGVAIHFLYKLWGKNTEKGNNLIIDEIHAPGGGIPSRMAPLVIMSTVVTHLFGGSAGREGTAVQVGGSMAAFIGRRLKLSPADVQIMLMAGIAAGFGAVFGTPVAGAVFALEVLVVGRIHYNALLPCLMASLMADVVTRAWGIHHTQYHISHQEVTTDAFSFIHFDWLLLLKVIAAGLAFGLISNLFATLTHQIKQRSMQWIKPSWLIPVTGGMIIVALTYAVGTTDYLGLGVLSDRAGGVSIVNAFHVSGATSFSWLWKLLFTAITLGMGFKGGEVTPLFFIGATLGNTLSVLLGAPADLMAGLGFIAVFAGATNTPLACTLMGIELFGGEYTIYYAVACFTAYYFSGHSGIYTSQKITTGKRGNFLFPKR
jgi:H+/Cl- antiporter ClcA